MNDHLISKQEAIDAAQKIIDTYEARMPKWSGNDMLTSGQDTATKYGHIADGAEKVQKAIENLPPKKPKKGKWIKQNPLVDTEECSICGYNIISEEMETPFCPWCGAEMEGK